MNRSFSPLQQSSDRIFQPWDRADFVWLLLLTVAALFLYTWRLDQPDLQPGTEQFFQDLSVVFGRSQSGSHPGFSLLFASGEQMTTLLHRAAAWCYAYFGVTPATTRLPGACLAATGIPLLYLVGRELFLRRPAALLGASIFLTQWAVLQQGRLASLQSIPLCTSLSVLYCLLRSRRDLRWTLGFGFVIGIQLWVDPVWGAGLAAIAVIFLLWDTPRLLTAKYFWWGNGLGLMAIAIATGIQQELNNVPFWRLQFWINHMDFLAVFPQPDETTKTILMPIRILGLTALPWLLCWPAAVWLLWHYIQFSWGKLSLIWGGVGLVLHLSGYVSIVLLYAILSLCCGAYLAQFWSTEEFVGLPKWLHEQYPQPLRWIAIVAAAMSWGILISGVWREATGHPFAYHWMGISIAATATTSAILITQNRSQWLPVLIWGTYWTLAQVLQTPFWLTVRPLM